jgi:hypothetical protein
MLEGWIATRESVALLTATTKKHADWIRIVPSQAERSLR